MDTPEQQQKPSAPETPSTPSTPSTAQDELPGMPEKGLATMLAEEILVLKEKQAELKEAMTVLKDRFVNEMREKQMSSIVVQKFEFEVDMVDKVTITKTKKAF